MNKIDDKEISELFVNYTNNNSEKDLELIYSKYSKLVYKIAFSILKNKEDSEDIVQNVFTKIYKMSKENLPTKNVLNWLYTVTKNEAISLLRTKKVSVDIDSIYEIQDKNDEINNIVEQEEFNRLINRLNELDKEIISLKILSQLPFSNIAKLLKKPVGTIKWRYYKSINRLHIILSNLTMSVITFVIGLKTIRKEKINDNKTTENIIENVQDQNIREEEISKSTTNMNYLDYMNETNEVVSEQEEAVVETNPFGVVSLSISIVFFVIAIISFIKYQPKIRFRASKK